MKEFAIKGKTISPQRVYVVAEMAWSHDGKKELALDIVRGAAAAGADCLSVHLTHVPAYMVPHYGSGKGRVSAGKEDMKIFQYLCDVNIKDEWWADIFGAARAAGLAVAVMANDYPSLALARSLNPDVYVIPAAAFNEEEFVRAVAAEKKPLLLRVGGATLGEIERVIGAVREQGVEDFVMLYGQQNYPTQIGDTELLKLATLKTVFNALVGLADHIDANDPLATQIPLMALPLGVCMIEKHLTHDRAKKGEDHESALNPDELADFIIRLRKAEKALGSPHFTAISESQRQYRLVSRKKVVAARAVAAGVKLQQADIAAKRSDQGLPAEMMPLLIGRKTAKALVENEGIDWAVLE